MISILLVTHGELGKSLIECATHVLGDQPLFLEFLSIENDCEHENIFKQISERINLLDQGDGVLILTDIFGGPSLYLEGHIYLEGYIYLAGYIYLRTILTLRYQLRQK